MYPFMIPAYKDNIGIQKRGEIMTQILIQYVLIVLLVVGIAYIVYILKEKGVSIKEDYFGIAYTVLDTVDAGEATPENIKSIIRAISKSVEYVESNCKNEGNSIKEKKALTLSKEALETFDFMSKLSDENIIYLIRLACAFLPPTNKPDAIIK